MQRTYIDRIFQYYEDKEEEVQRPATGVWLRRILVVDDEASIRNMYYRLCTRQGFDVMTAANADEANDILVHEHVDIIFLDINMLEVEGDVLFELIRAFHRHVKVVVSSVYPLEEQKERIKHADAYFDKSDSQDTLLQIVSALL